jgi:lysozyme
MAKPFPEATTEDRRFLTNEEGKVPYVYDDAIYPTRKYVKGTRIKGNLTGGVGHLLSKGSKIFAEAHAWIGKTIPNTVIDQWLDDDLDTIERLIHNIVKVPLNTRQRGTLLIWGFNVGNGAVAASSLIRKLNQKNYNAVPGELQKWTKTTINGKKVTSPGLVARRAREAAYWSGGVGPAIVSPKTKIEPKSTEIAEPQVKKWTPEEIIGAGSVVATTVGAGFTVTEPILVYTFAAILVVTLLGVGFIFVKRQFFPS